MLFTGMHRGSDADTPKPRKKIPLWARNPELEVALERQQFINPDSIFVTDPRVIGKVDLEGAAVFSENTRDALVSPTVVFISFDRNFQRIFTWLNA